MESSSTYVLRVRGSIPRDTLYSWSVSREHSPHYAVHSILRAPPNGPTCLFLHPECAAALLAKLNAIDRDAAHPPRPRFTFDSTLGFPGEGPVRVATYNINGTKGGKLAAVLSQARKAGVDILLLQELHAYENGSHHRSHRTATLLGWHWFASPGELGDPASGVAIATRDACARVTPSG